MYRITYEQGNGYSCGCCRRTWTNTANFNTADEVQEWIDELYASYKIPEYEDDDDRSIESIEKEIGVDIQDQFSPIQENVDRIIAERMKIKEEKELEKKKAEEAEEYRKYLKLKEKFEKQ